MGKGVALSSRSAFPAMFEDYVSRCEQKTVRLGQPYLYRDASGISILNFRPRITGARRARLQDIERGLDYFAQNAAKWDITSVAMPPLGCGNGGLEWSEIGPLIYRKLHQLPLDVEVYAPYGTRRMS